MIGIAKVIYLDSKQNEAKTVSNVTLLQGKRTLHAVCFEQDLMDKLDTFETMDNLIIDVNVYGKEYNGKAQTQIIINGVYKDDKKKG